MHATRSAFAGPAILAAALALSGPGARAQTPTVGLLVNDARAANGYTLFSPMQSAQTSLIDVDGRLVHSWTASGKPGLMAYLLPDGHLLRAVALQPNVHANWAQAAGGGGRIEEYDWDGNLLWTLDWEDATKYQHHDYKKLPSGNILFISWMWKSRDEAIAAGRDPARAAAGGFWPDAIFEIEPTPPSGGNVVWEWHVWDHLVQDLDPSKANYGVVADHPELFDINAFGDDGQLDFNHLNGIDYNPDLDQIVISSRAFSEIYVIDHSTTTTEAASHSGGRHGRGGDILYRWGNPAKYDRGTTADRILFNQHDAQWIPPGYPGEGNILIFNNGLRRPDGSYSSADEITPPVNASGGYDIVPGAPFEPAALTWTWQGTPRTGFFSPIIAGVQRLPNGNTLIDEGTKGNLVQVTPAGEIAWRYVNPDIGTGPLDQGDPVPGFVTSENAIFKMRWYSPDDPGLQGRDLDPGDMIEIYDPPPPVPDGSGGTAPVRVTKLDPAAGAALVSWDAVSCTAADYALFFGDLRDVASMNPYGTHCALGVSGAFAWSAVPAGNIYFVMVGIGEYPIYESRWGTDSFGNERHGTRPSLACEVTTKSLVRACP